MKDETVLLDSKEIAIDIRKFDGKLEIHQHVKKLKVTPGGVRR